ncbi:MAG: phage holin family protein [bacterium]|nr:phage holin family protein [bacterium]
MNIIIHWLVSAVAVFIAAYLLPGVDVSGIGTVLIVAVVLGALNAILKPVLFVLTLPITILTLGLFALVLNAAMVLLASWIVEGFKVDGFIWALLFALIVSLISSVLNSVAKKEDPQ